MKAKGQKADFAELEHQPIKGLYQNKDKSGQVRYYYFYRGNERVSATADLTTALERFFTQQQPQPILKLNQLKLSDCLDKYLVFRQE